MSMSARPLAARGHSHGGLRAEPTSYRRLHLSRRAACFGPLQADAGQVGNYQVKFVVGQDGILRADWRSAQPGVSPAVLRSFAVGSARLSVENLPGFARLGRLPIGPQLGKLPHRD